MNAMYPIGRCIIITFRGRIAPIKRGRCGRSKTTMNAPVARSRSDVVVNPKEFLGLGILNGVVAPTAVVVSLMRDDRSPSVFCWRWAG